MWGGFKRQDVALHFKHLSLFIDVINFLLHHLMWHVWLQMWAQKLPAARCLWGQQQWFGPVWPCFLALGSHQTPPVIQSNFTLIPAHQWALFSIWRNPTPLISDTAPYWNCGRRGLEEMDGSERAAVSSNCKILVILDSGSWLMGLIWRLPPFGPPFNTGGREEGITDHSEEGLRQGRWHPDAVEPDILETVYKKTLSFINRSHCFSFILGILIHILNSDFIFLHVALFYIVMWQSQIFFFFCPIHTWINLWKVNRTNRKNYKTVHTHPCITVFAFFI